MLRINPFKVFINEPDYVVVEKKNIRPSFADLLQNELEDPKAAERISRQFDRFLAPHLSSIDSLIVQTALVNHAYMLGSWNVDFFEEFMSKPYVGPIITRYPDQFKNFFLSILDVKLISIESENKTIHVTIICPEVGQGHIAISQAIKEHLTSLGGYKVTILFENEVCLPSDVFYQTGITYKGKLLTWSDIYNKISLEENNPEKANEYFDQADSLRAYVPSRKMELLKKAIPLDTDLIFIPASHQHSSFMQLAYKLGIPVSVFTSDYSIEPTLLQMVAKCHKQFVKLCIPSDDPAIFANARIERANWKQIEVIGYPVRVGCTTEKNPEEIALIRSSLEIEKEETVVLLSMGSHPNTEVLISAIDELKAEKEYSTSLHVIVICGKNKNAFEILRKHVLSTPHPNLRFQVHGYVEDMAKLYKISKVLIGKPGASSCSETYASGVYFLALCLYPWESWNISFLRHRKAGETLSDHSIGRQIKGVLENGPEMLPLELDWKTLLVQHIRSTIDEFKKATS